MIYDFQSGDVGDGIYDFGGSIIIAALFNRGCVHLTDYAANTVSVDDFAVNTVALYDYAPTTVCVSDEAC